MTAIQPFSKIVTEWNLRCFAKGGYFAGNPKDSAAVATDRKAFLRDTMHGPYLGFRLVRHASTLQQVSDRVAASVQGVNQ